jgi:hypothetical protein
VAWAPDLPEPGPAADPSAGLAADRSAGAAADRSAGAARPAGTALRGSRLSEYAEMPRLLVLRRLQSTPRGLVEDDAQARLARCGDNAVTSGRPAHWSVMLPVVVTAALARGARVMLRLGVIVKQLPAIHNLGAMDVLCTDKTGTLTYGHAALDFCVDARGRPDPDVLRWACLNSLWLTEDAGGQVTDPLDEALLKRAAELGLAGDQGFAGVEVIPFAFTTRCATVVLRPSGLLGAHLVITKGAPDEVLERCDQLRTAAGTMALGPDEHAQLTRLADDHAAGGVRLLAVATAEVPPRMGRYRPAGEAGLTLAGFVGFRDKPKDSAAAAVRALTGNGIEVKVVTGDHPLVAAHACREVGMSPGRVVLGDEIDLLTDGALAGIAARTVLFARVGRNRAAWPVLLGAVGIFAVGLGLPLSPLAPAIGMHAPPMAFFPLLAAVLAGYCAIIMAVRAVYLRAGPRWL